MKIKMKITMRKTVNAVLAFVATAAVLPLLAVAMPFVATWNDTED